MTNRLQGWIREAEEGIGTMSPEIRRELVDEARARGERLAEMVREFSGEVPSGAEDVAAELVEALALLGRALERLERQAMGAPCEGTAAALADEAEDLLASVDYRMAGLQSSGGWEG